MDRAAAQNWVDDFLTERVSPPRDDAHFLAAPPQTERFSPFIPEQVRRAAEVAGALRTAAAATDTPEAGLAAARDKLDEFAGTESAPLLRQALKVFVAHDDAARPLTVEPLEVRAPLKAVQSFATVEEMMEMAVENPEMLVAWFREDPQANEHHDHWHAVYPTQGVLEPGLPGGRIQARHGELFFYMHEQMLARYDTERLTMGLGRVVALTGFDTIAEGYDPTAGLRGLPKRLWLDNLTPGKREPNSEWPSVDFTGDNQLSDLVTADGLVDEIAATGSIQRPNGSQVPATPSLLGAAVEPTVATPNPNRYGWTHGAGHIFISSATDGDPGVMLDTDTAIRDPAFFRWHKHVDDRSRELQNKRGPRDFATEKHPAVEIRDSDLILLLREGLPPNLTIEQLAGHVEQAIGGAHFDEPFATPDDNPLVTDTLVTHMKRRPLQIKGFENPPEPVMIDYLDKKPFLYAVRISNPGPAVDLVVRLFIVAEQCQKDREMYIEIDKWVHHAGANSKSVAVRHDSESSVIRKPATEVPGALAHSPQFPGPPAPHPWDTDSYCTCGWPYNLLLPMGTAAGMPFRMVAVATNWGDDGVKSSTCGSVSYCGAKEGYPDKREMGYPFDRPFPAGGIAATIAARPEMASRPFKIRCENPPVAP